MYTVLLVDDEISVTETLKNSIPWTDLGISTIYTATDGLQALSIIQEHPIDLLITDIQMPKMNGLELLKQIRSSHSAIHCILLTAYGEFEYARTALCLGVENYLLKPLQIGELTDTIENAIDNLHKHRSNAETLFQENILRRWLNGSISAEELGERSGMLNINIYHAAYCAVCMRKLDSGVSLSAYGNTVLNSLRPCYDCYGVWDNQGNYVLILCGDTIALQQIADTLLSVTQNMNLSGKLCMTIGNPVYYCGDLKGSYLDAVKLINQPEAFVQNPVRICPTAFAQTSLLPDIDDSRLSPIILKALEYIRSGYAESVSLKEFCSDYAATAAYIGYLFKKETDTYFNNYLNLYRIDKAIEMLVSTSLKVNDIAVKTGFSSTSYFISAFKKHTGMSPQKYREQVTL